MGVLGNRVAAIKSTMPRKSLSRVKKTVIKKIPIKIFSIKLLGVPIKKIFSREASFFLKRKKRIKHKRMKSMMGTIHTFCCPNWTTTCGKLIMDAEKVKFATIKVS